jgi:hypothetical protein
MCQFDPAREYVKGTEDKYSSYTFVYRTTGRYTQTHTHTHKHTHTHTHTIRMDAMVNTHVPIRYLDPVFVNWYGWFI